MTKIPFTECQMEEGMRKAEARRPVSHTHTHPLPLMQAAPWAASLSFCSAAGIGTNIHFSLTLQSHHAQGAEPQRAHPRPPKGPDRQRSPDPGRRDLCWWSAAPSREASNGYIGTRGV